MVKDGKRKVKDGDTGRVSWRQGKKGFSKDYDGDPIAQNYNAKDLKKQPKHRPHFGGKKRGHRPHKGQREAAYESSE